MGTRTTDAGKQMVIFKVAHGAVSIRWKCRNATEYLGRRIQLAKIRRWLKRRPSLGV